MGPWKINETWCFPSGSSAPDGARQDRMVWMPMGQESVALRALQPLVKVPALTTSKSPPWIISSSIE